MNESIFSDICDKSYGTGESLAFVMRLKCKRDI